MRASDRSLQKQKQKLGRVYVVNKHHCSSKFIWCGRPSPVGNPYPMTNRSSLERDRVCDLYEIWFTQQMQSVTPAAVFVRDLVDRVLRGEEVRLGCVCKQKHVEVRCHCDTIKRFVDTQALKERKKDYRDLL